MESGVVVGYDPTPSSEHVIDVAAQEAALRGVDLAVIHVLHHHLISSTTDQASVRAESSSQHTPQEVAEQGAELARTRHPGLSVRALSVTGSAPAALAAASADADLLVVGHRHGGFAGLRLGSVALRTVARAGCPAVVVRGAADGPRGTVLAAVDDGDTAEEILGFAVAEAARRGARLKVVKAWEMLWPFAHPGDRGELNRASDEARERAGEALEGLLDRWRAEYPDVAVECELAPGDPAEVLTDATTYGDLIVVGGRRRGEHHRGMHIGPIATMLLMHADCPVAVVPHD